jgi:hypothetical protein
MKDAAPGEEPGIYRLTIAGTQWQQIAKFDGLTVSSDGWEGFPSVAPDGQVAMMSDTSAVQVYSIKWNKSSNSR